MQVLPSQSKTCYMKTVIFRLGFLLPVLLLLQACFKGDIQPPQTVSLSNPVSQPSATAENILFRGAFMPTSGITISGVAKVLKDSIRQVVKLDSFSVSPGPDLKVYLSKEYPAINFINLGSLQRNIGVQVYTLPDAVDFASYKYVLIHCQQYNHLFGFALLK